MTDFTGLSRRVRALEAQLGTPEARIRAATARLAEGSNTGKDWRLAGANYVATIREQVVTDACRFRLTWRRYGHRYTGRDTWTPEHVLPEYLSFPPSEADAGCAKNFNMSPAPMAPPFEWMLELNREAGNDLDARWTPTLALAINMNNRLIYRHPNLDLKFGQRIPQFVARIRRILEHHERELRTAVNERCERWDCNSECATGICWVWRHCACRLYRGQPRTSPDNR